MLTYTNRNLKLLITTPVHGVLVVFSRGLNLTFGYTSILECYIFHLETRCSKSMFGSLVPHELPHPKHRKDLAHGRDD